MRSISSSSVYLIDVKNPAAPQVERVLKPGLLVGQVEGGTAACSGSHPHSVVETRRAIFVANGNNDTINVFDRSSLRRLHDIELAPSFGPQASVLRRGDKLARAIALSEGLRHKPKSAGKSVPSSAKSSPG